MALVLTVGAGLLTSSYRNLAQVDLGYRPAETLALTLTPRDGAYEEAAARRTAYRELLARIRAAAALRARGRRHGRRGRARGRGTGRPRPT